MLKPPDRGRNCYAAQKAQMMRQARRGRGLVIDFCRCDAVSPMAGGVCANSCCCCYCCCSCCLLLLLLLLVLAERLSRTQHVELGRRCPLARGQASANWMLNNMVGPGSRGVCVGGGGIESERRRGRRESGHCWQSIGQWREMRRISMLSSSGDAK